MSAPQERLVSLDVLRGFDMLFIMGFASFLAAVARAFGCEADGWLVRQLSHPKFLGLTFYDTIFPLFIFIAGAVFPFSCAKALEGGRSRLAVARHVLWRAVALFLLGMVYERYFAGVAFRFGSVLGRIGIAWGSAAILYLAFGWRTRAAIACALLAGYGALNLFVPAPDNPLSGVWTPQGNVVCWFDRTFIAPLGRIAPGTSAWPFDNQTFLSNATACVTALLGVFAGEFVFKTRAALSGARRVARMFAAAGALAAASLLVAYGLGPCSIPFSKVLWSVSFTLAVGAYSVAMFALFHLLVDVTGWWRHTLFFRVIGMNALTIYLAQPLLNLHGLNAWLFGRFAALFPSPWVPSVRAFTYVALCWLLLYFLYRKRVFLKI